MNGASGPAWGRLDDAKPVEAIWRVRPLAMVLMESEMNRALEKASGEYLGDRVAAIMQKLRSAQAEVAAGHGNGAAADADDTAPQQACQESKPNEKVICRLICRFSRVNSADPPPLTAITAAPFALSHTVDCCAAAGLFRPR